MTWAPPSAGLFFLSRQGFSLPDLRRWAVVRNCARMHGLGRYEQKIGRCGQARRQLVPHVEPGRPHPGFSACAVPLQRVEMDAYFVFCIWIALCIVVGMGTLAGLSLSFLGSGVAMARAAQFATSMARPCLAGTKLRANRCDRRARRASGSRREALESIEPARRERCSAGITGALFLSLALARKIGDG